jgi:hypothetical protein
MTPSSLSDRIKQANSTSKDVAVITEQLTSTLNLNDEPINQSDSLQKAEDSPDELDWEKLADKELETPEFIKPSVSVESNSSTLELYGFDSKLQMHQLVKEFTKIVDPTGSMSFRPKMVNQSLILTFNNPRHGYPPYLRKG